MIVRHYMATDVVTAVKETTIQEALRLMKEHSIRHLPVVDGEDRLLGWVSDADLRGVLIASMLEELTLEDVMIRHPYTTHPRMELSGVARLMLERRIGGLPVLEDGVVVGVITVVDVLGALLPYMGALSKL
jgi:acetoin utilization protein AcuB